LLNGAEYAMAIGMVVKTYGNVGLKKLGGAYAHFPNRRKK